MAENLSPAQVASLIVRDLLLNKKEQDVFNDIVVAIFLNFCIEKTSLVKVLKALNKFTSEMLTRYSN
jgi:hypothetical protein